MAYHNMSAPTSRSRFASDEIDYQIATNKNTLQDVLQNSLDWLKADEDGETNQVNAALLAGAAAINGIKAQEELVGTWLTADAPTYVFDPAVTFDISISPDTKEGLEVLLAAGVFTGALEAHLNMLFHDDGPWTRDQENIAYYNSLVSAAQSAE